SSPAIDVEVEAGGTVGHQRLYAAIPPLPARFPIVEVLALDPQRVEPGWTLFDIKVPNGGPEYLVVLDEDVAPIWWWAVNTGDARLTGEGLLWVLGGGDVRESDWLG